MQAGGRYGVSLYLHAPHGAPTNATVSLLAGGDPALPPAVLANLSCAGVGRQWQRCKGELHAAATDHSARLAVSSRAGAGAGRALRMQLWEGGSVLQAPAPAAAAAPEASSAARFNSAPHTQVLFDGPGALVLDSVSLFTAEAVERGRAAGLLNPWPFRADLLGALRALRPR